MVIIIRLGIDLSYLEFQIKLEGNTYNAGEEAKGTVLIKADKSLKVRKLKFSVHGKERYEEGSGSWDSYNWAERFNTFFFADLSSFLKSVSASPHSKDSMEISEGDFAIPFHFSIPDTALESYHGRNIRIIYEVEISADMGRWKKGPRHIVSFEVLNPNMIYTFSGDRTFLGEDQEKKEGKPYLDLELEMTNGSKTIPRFPQGGIISGKLNAENCDTKKIRKAIVQLSAIEHPRWGRYNNILVENVKKEIQYNEEQNRDNIITFETQIPQNAKRSYCGQYSEYYWILETKMDISGSSDIHANRIIQVT